MRGSKIFLYVLIGSLLSFAGAALAAPTPTQRLADLPLPAQATIAAALGKDQPAYHAMRQGAGFRVSNPRHGFTATLMSTGLRLQQGDGTARLHLTGWGYGRPSQPLPPAAPQATANQIEYRRGALTEWYINGPLGLEQGMTLSRPPRLRRAGPLTLAMRLDGDVTLQVDESRTAAVWRTRAGTPILRYTGLTVTDVTGATLPAWLTTDGSRLLIQVDEARARYPVTIDPFIQQAKLTASDGMAGDSFGFSVAISGDGATLVVGAPNADIGGNVNQGAAYVFSVTYPGGIPIVTQTAKLSISFCVFFCGLAQDYFGHAVAISGDGNIIVVGAPGFDWNHEVDAGIAYTFTKFDTNGWTDRTDSDSVLTGVHEPGEAFGSSVAISSDGKTLVVGAPNADIGGNVNQGAAYVFYEETNLRFVIASDGAAGDEFGSSVAISSDGKTLVVGAWLANVGANVDQGKAYVFSVGIVPDESFLVTEVAKLTASDGLELTPFGAHVAISADGDTVVVGSAYTDIGNNRDQGAAYVFAKPLTGWGNMTQTAKLTASDGLAGDFFGISVAMSGDGKTIVVGAVFADLLLIPGVSFNEGAAYVFAKPMTGWTTMTETVKLLASDGQPFDLFGFAVAISGDTVVVGVSENSIDANSGQGAAYLFRHVPKLTVNIDGSGSVAGPRIACPPDCREDYDVGASVTLTPTAERNWEFDRWSGDPDCADGVLTMNADKQCTAHFVQPRPDLVGNWTTVSQSCRKGKCTVKGTLEVWNYGKATAPASSLRVFLSADTSLDAGDMAAAKDKNVKSIKPKRGKKVEIKWTLPVGVNGAGMYLVGLIDPNNAVSESNEGNNTLMSGTIP